MTNEELLFFDSNINKIHSFISKKNSNFTPEI